MKFVAAALKLRKVGIWVLSLRHMACCCLGWAGGEARGENGAGADSGRAAAMRMGRALPAERGGRAAGLILCLVCGLWQKGEVFPAVG